MSGFLIEYLADYPKAIGACASWDFGRWDVRKKGATLEASFKLFAQAAQKDRLPLTVVAIDEGDQLPVAMGSLWEQDGAEWSKVTPWIASLYVHHLFRGQGIARAIVKRLEDEARRLGYEEVYLKTGNAGAMYEIFGYSEIDQQASKYTKLGMRSLYKKDLI